MSDPACYTLVMTDIASTLNPVVSLEKTTRFYSGEFGVPAEFVIAPATVPHFIAYWSLSVNKIVSDKGTLFYYRVQVASLRTAQSRSTFVEDYISRTDYSGYGLNLLPVEIIDAIAQVTGENLRAAYDAQVEYSKVD